jgi:hypothetical protein
MEAESLKRKKMIVSIEIGEPQCLSGWGIPDEAVASR